MKITFQPTESPEIGNQNITKYHEPKASGTKSVYGVTFGQSGDRNWIAGKLQGREKGKTLAELQQEAGNIDVAVQQDYRTVLSNTMSAEDYAQLEEEGFDFGNLDPETAVTIVDKIKAELIRSGQHVAGYTDDLNMDTLAAALGSESLAGAIADSFEAADIPVTEDNIDSVKKAWDMVAQLNAPSEGSYRYMVDNGMDAEVWNFYLSQSSGAALESGAEQGRPVGQPRFYAEDIKGYFTETAKDGSESNLREEIDRILTREGLEANEENRQAARTLLEGRLPITKENLARLQELKSVEFPVTESTFARAAASAIAEGKDPIYSNLAKADNIYEKAAELFNYFWNDAEQTIDLENVTARRNLEEIRLRMSAEVNVKLIRSGFAIDTASMEQLVEELRKIEAEVAKEYFPQDAEAVSKYQIYRSTNETVQELPGLPAQLLGPWSAEDHLGTLAQFHAEGKALQATYEKAQTGYETLMTAPRKDLGDSIRKAFANVDDILQDLGLETSEANQRAVRILGYNRMNIDAENIERVQAADKQVQSVVEKMTPATVLKMIRDGQNPLEMSFDRLEQYFDSLPESYEEASESYSRFLYGLEQNKQISVEERESYIGIYRMLHQIDASDGAVIGALVNTGAELHFSNLLSAVRSGKFKSMDVSVADDFGATVDLIRKGVSISEQIAKGFMNTTQGMLTEMSYSEEIEKSYQQMELQQLRQAATVDAESVEMLIRGQLPLSADHLLASQALTDPSYNPFKEWKMKKEQMEQDVESANDAMDDAILNLTEHLGSKEDFLPRYQEVLDVMDAEAQEMSLGQADSSMDVRSLQLLHKQLSVARNMAKQEEYIFPMYVGEELTKVHLTLEQSASEKGSVSVSIDISEEHLEGHFRALNGKITGFLVGNSEAAVTKLERIADIFTDSVKNNMEGDWEVDELPVVARQENAVSHRKQAAVNREVPGGEETYKEVDNTELYRIAKVFLEAVQK